VGRSFQDICLPSAQSRYLIVELRLKKNISYEEALSIDLYRDDGAVIGIRAGR
jgi:hypothetical protein